jgi:hypothetical protein
MLEKTEDTESTLKTDRQAVEGVEEGQEKNHLVGEAEKTKAKADVKVREANA